MEKLYRRTGNLLFAAIATILIIAPHALGANEDKPDGPPVQVLLPPVGDEGAESYYFPGRVLRKVFAEVELADHYQVSSSLGEVYDMTYPLRRESGWFPGRKHPYMTVVSASRFGSLVLGSGPYVYGKPANELRALMALPGEVTVFVTLDMAIRTLDDLRDRRVGVAERGDLFRGTFTEQPYFAESFGDIKWVAGGAMRNVQALLRGELDCVLCTFWAKLARQSDGTLKAVRLLPDPATDRLLKERPDARFLSFDRNRIFSAYDDLEERLLLPVAIQQGSGTDPVIWGRGNSTLLVGPENLDTVRVKKLVAAVDRYRKNRQENDKLAALLPDDLRPFVVPVGDWVHPAVQSAGSEPPR